MYTMIKKDIVTKNSERAFTLVELIVSVGLFAIVVTIAMTAYLRLIAIDRESRATNDIVTNLNFVVDAMARGIRTGSNFNCGSTGGNCPANANRFSYVNEQGVQVTYILLNNGVTSSVGECLYVIPESACTQPSGRASAVTDPRINIENLAFYSRGISSATEGIQPQVTFTIKGSIRLDPSRPPRTFTIESGATQRLLDI
jgi:prepilin-type N-terminal cleavage/methylation domain-containing protein